MTPRSEPGGSEPEGGSDGVGAPSNLPRLSFHRVHGKNLRLSSNGFSASRYRSTDKGIAFSARPVHLNEKVMVRILHVNNAKAGGLVFGFTSHDPANFAAQWLPISATLLHKKPGYWISKLDPCFCKQDTILVYYVTSAGVIHFGIYGEEKKMIFKERVEIKGELWAFLDIKWKCTAVQFCDPVDPTRRESINLFDRIPFSGVSVLQLSPSVHLYRDVEEDVSRADSFRSPRLDELLFDEDERPASNISSPSSSSVDELPSKRRQSVDVDERLAGSLSSLSVDELPSPQRHSVDADELPPLRYQNQGFRVVPLALHYTRGLNVCSVTEHGVAEREESNLGRGTVFTAHPVRPGETLLLQILATTTKWAGSLALGLTSCDPATLQPAELPFNAESLLDRPEYWVVLPNAADGMLRGDELAVTLTVDGEVKVGRNGFAPTTKMHVDHSLRLWAFFDMYGKTHKVRLLAASPAPPQLRVQLGGGAMLILPPLADVQNDPNHQAGLTLASIEPRVNQSQLSYTIFPQPMLTHQQANWTHHLDPGTIASSSHQQPIDSIIEDTFVMAATGTDCAICFENPIDCVLYMCGHMCMCYRCAVKQRRGKDDAQCPLCRATIKDVIRTFKS